MDEGINKVLNWVEDVIEIGKGYFLSYPKWILYLAGGLVLAKFFKLKIDVKSGGK